MTTLRIPSHEEGGISAEVAPFLDPQQKRRLEAERIIAEEVRLCFNVASTVSQKPEFNITDFDELAIIESILRRKALLGRDESLEATYPGLLAECISLGQGVMKITAEIATPEEPIAQVIPLRRS